MFSLLFNIEKMYTVVVPFMFSSITSPGRESSSLDTSNDQDVEDFPGKDSLRGKLTSTFDGNRFFF